MLLRFNVLLDLASSRELLDICMEYKYEQLYNFYESHFDVRIS